MNGTALTSQITTPSVTLTDTPCPTWCAIDHGDTTLSEFLREDHQSIDLRITMPGHGTDHPLAVASISDAGSTTPYIDVWSSVTDARLDANGARSLAVRMRQMAAHLELLAGLLP